MTDCNTVIKDIEYAKDLLQNRPEQDTVDYKVWKVLDDALDLIHDLRGQIVMLVGAQHAMTEIMGEKQDSKAIEKAKKQSVEYAQDRIIVPFKEADMIIALLKEQDNCENCAIAIENRQPVFRCKDCKHRPKKPDWETYEDGGDIEFPDGKCPCQCSSDRYYSWYPDDDWFCADGERE